MEPEVFLKAIYCRNYQYVFDYIIDHDTIQYLEELRNMIYEADQNIIDTYYRKILHLIVKYNDEPLFDYLASKITYLEHIYDILIDADKPNYINLLIYHGKFIEKNIISIADSHFYLDQRIEWIYVMIEHLSPDEDDLREIGMILASHHNYIDEKIVNIFLGNDYQLFLDDFKNYLMHGYRNDLSIKRWMEHGSKDDADNILNHYIGGVDLKMVTAIVQSWREYLTPKICIWDAFKYSGNDIQSIVDVLEYLREEGFEIYYEERDNLNHKAICALKLSEIFTSAKQSSGILPIILMIKKLKNRCTKNNLLSS